MKIAVTIAAVMSAGVLAAVTIGPDWCVTYPQEGSKDVNVVLKIAAEEVRDDINEATGLKLIVVPASKAKSPAIYIGAEFARKAGFDLSGFKWYDNAIAEKGGSIYLFGNDRPGRDPAKYGRLPWSKCVIPSVKAATRFLETAAGVRFLMPGEVGKEVPRRKEISLADGFFSKETPSLIYGSGFSANDRSLILRVANGIWGMGPFHSYGGHTYGTACPRNKFFKSHPEYFALKNGNRVFAPTIGQTPLCISNPEVEELIVAELKRRFEMGADVCQLGQQDGGIVCECEKCTALYGTGNDWGEKFWIFHRKIAERMLKECPGKIVHILSYALTVHPPKTFKVFPSNVMIEKCSYSEESFKEWDGYTVPHGFTVYTYLCGCYQLPGFVARRSFAELAQVVSRLRKYNVRGIYGCGAGGSVGDLYGTEGPGYYIYYRLIQDGSLNVNALLSDYCSAAFGPASAQMREFYDVQDARLRMFGKIAEGFPSGCAEGLDGYLSARPKNPLDLHGLMFSPDTTSRMEECLSCAEKTAGLTVKQRKRLELVRLEFDYAKNLGAISTLYSAYKLRPCKEFLVALIDEVEKRNAFLDRVFEGKDRPKRLEGWPELSLFGYENTRAIMNVNGRLSAPIGAPLSWSAKSFADILSGSGKKKLEACRTKRPPDFSEFDSETGWNDIGGISMRPVPVKARFKAMHDADNLYVLVETDLADDVVVKEYSRDGSVWNDEVVDILVAPGGTRDVYYHLIYGVGAEARYDDVTGLITDTLDPDYGKADAMWNGKGWKTESRRGGGKWRSIATLPYSDFGIAAPNTGDTWFINVGRIARTGEKRKDEVLMLWAPNFESLSLIAPNAMGKLIFK